jgi:hypothetical protein
VSACSDADDNIFLECAQAAAAQYLVTGNVKDFLAVWVNTPDCDRPTVSRCGGVKLTIKLQRLVGYLHWHPEIDLVGFLIVEVRNYRSR